MNVSELGESGLIARISEIIDRSRDESAPAWQNLVLGIGDDAAVWQCGNSLQVATVDSLRQGIHFDLEITGWRDLGWKALAVNLSDIAAMGGSPRYALVSLAIPGTTESEDVFFLYQGLTELARQSGVAVAGGDTDRAPLVEISITLVGSVPNRDALLTRSAARPGDKIAVTGALGAAAGGLEMLSQHLHFDNETASSLKSAFLRPTPRLTEGLNLVECGVKTAIDISDGLLSEIGHVCRASQTGARIEAARIPVSPAVQANFGSKALELALAGGEDYELLFTATDDVVERVRNSLPCPVTVIGEITGDDRREVRVISEDGSIFETHRTGWEHFSEK